MLADDANGGYVPASVAREMPPTKPAENALEEEVARLLVAIESNYYREGSGHGSRFEGERLEVVQARAVIRRVRGELTRAGHAQ